MKCGGSSRKRGLLCVDGSRKPTVIENLATGHVLRSKGWLCFFSPEGRKDTGRMNEASLLLRASLHLRALAAQAAEK
jgi:hypothetical protein